MYLKIGAVFRSEKCDCPVLEYDGHLGETQLWEGLSPAALAPRHLLRPAGLGIWPHFPDGIFQQRDAFCVILKKAVVKPLMQEFGNNGIKPGTDTWQVQLK